MSEPLSLLLVTVDCLRADHVGFHGYSVPTTPFLDSLARESFLVPNAFVGGVPTYYSFPTIFAARHPLALGRDVAGLAPDETTLVSHLKAAGYATAAFVAANPYVSAKFGYDQGFDRFEDFLDQESIAGSMVRDEASPHRMRSRLNRELERVTSRFGPAASLYRDLYFQYCQLATPKVKSVDDLRQFPSAATLVDHAIAWLKSVHPRRFFLWLHLMDPHAPYYPPEQEARAIGSVPMNATRMRYLNSYWNRRDLPASRLQKYRSPVMELYDASIRWVDTQMSRLAAALRDLNQWDRCVLAFTADHGEEFLEHGERFHAPWTMKEELIRVPLLVRVPGWPGGTVSRQPFSHINLAPTLVDAMQIPVPTDFQGQSLWNEWQSREDWDEPVIVESSECLNPNRPETRLAARVLCVREERYKLILRFATGEQQLFDLQQDRHECNPLPADAEKRTRRGLLEIAHEHMERTRRADITMRRLRAQLREVRSHLSAGGQQNLKLETSSMGAATECAS